MVVILAIHTKTASKLSSIDIIHCFEAFLFTTTIGAQYDDYSNHTIIIGTTVCFMVKMVVIAKIKHIPIAI